MTTIKSVTKCPTCGTEFRVEVVGEQHKYKPAMKYVPKDGEQFYYIHALFCGYGKLDVRPLTIHSEKRTYCYHEFKEMIAMGNCFRTKAEAQCKIRQIKELFKA